MSSVHNDLATWAGKARANGRDTIEITTDLADEASEEIVELSCRVQDLEAALRYISSPSQTEKLLWWQIAAREALNPAEGS